MTFFIFHDPTTDSSSKINFDKFSNMNELKEQIKENFNIPNCKNLSIFMMGRPPIIYKTDDDINKMKEISTKIRNFKIAYEIIKHGDQEIDMSPSKFGTVRSGFKRLVRSDANAGDVVIGDPNGAVVRIPAGAVSKDKVISIKSIDVDDPNGIISSNNVTRHVPCNMNEVNRRVNK